MCLQSTAKTLMKMALKFQPSQREINEFSLNTIGDWKNPHVVVEGICKTWYRQSWRPNKMLYVSKIDLWCDWFSFKMYRADAEHCIQLKISCSASFLGGADNANICHVFIRPSRQCSRCWITSSTFKFVSNRFSEFQVIFKLYILNARTSY